MIGAALGAPLTMSLAASMAADAPGRIAVAVALPMSGPRQALGREIKTAIELTVADLVARKPRAGPEFDISWHDDQCSTDGGLAVAQNIIALSPRPDAVIGHACPSAAQAATQLYSAAGLVVIVAGALPARPSTLVRSGVHIFRMQSDGDQGSTLGNALADAGPEARIAVVRDKTQFAVSVMSSAVGALMARGRSPALVETFAGGDKDFGALALRLKAAHVTHLALAAFPSEAALLVAEVRAAAPHIAILATDTLAEQAFARAAGTAADGVQIALAPDVHAWPGAANLAERLTARGIPPSRAAIASAAAIELLAAAMSRAPTDSMAATLARGSFDTVLGAMTFDKHGAALLPSHVLYTWQGGTLRSPQSR